MPWVWDGTVFSKQSREPGRIVIVMVNMCGDNSCSEKASYVPVAPVSMARNRRNVSIKSGIY